MKHLKTYEDTIEDEPHAGDFVILKENDANLGFYKDLNDFITDNIGVISGFMNNDEISVLFPYNIISAKIKNFFTCITPNDYKSAGATTDILKKLNVDKNEKLGYRLFDRDDILYFSPNKEKLEMLLSTNKYNI